MELENRPVATNIIKITLLYGLHCLIPAIILLTTAKGSALRYLSIPCLFFMAYQSVGVATALGPGFVWCELARLFVTVAFQSLNLLLINPKDGTDVPSKKNQTFIARVYHAIRLFAHPRGVNTPWQIKNVPPHPAYYSRRGFNVPPRGRFLIRQLCIVVWQYLALDVFATVALQQALEQKETNALPQIVQWDLSIEQWIERLVSNVVAGFVVSRMLIDSYHRGFSIIAVGLGLDSPSDCPPLFGRAVDAVSIQGFWGKFWHQMVRQPFGSVSTYITRDILGLQPRSLLQRYTTVFLIFFFSGGLHVILDVVQGIPGNESGAMLLFMTAPLGLMVEDGIKAVWKWARFGSKSEQSAKEVPTPVWQRVLGFIWAMMWLGLASTWYLYPQMLRPENQNLVPFSLAGVIGLPVVGGIVVVWGLFVAFVFEAEI